ncbi:hypothetical protein MLD38_013543 [Melastoma candidum]|uniref:Uncharacterized protein n=1 Tax=Melastoma candidum TaxID=119954 RepID=A0ACB9R9C2_9MYRT|nr:hypothetical protein MLD38_013543 [Melastoma candidum]
MFSVVGRKGTAEPSTRSYHLAWMAHWKVAELSPNSKSEFLSLNREAGEVGSDSTGGVEVTSSLSDVPKTDNRFCEVPAKNTVSAVNATTNSIDIVNRKTVMVASQCSVEEGRISAPSLALAPPWPGNASFPIRNQRVSGFSYHKARTPLTMHSFPKDPIEESADISEHAFESENFPGKKDIVFSTHCQESHPGSSSRQVSRSLDDAKGNSLSMALSTAKLDNHASMTSPSLWNRAASLLQHDYAPTGQKKLVTQPAESSPLKATNCNTFSYEHSSRPSHGVVDVMATRTHAFVDPSERLTAGPMKFAQTMHHLFIGEKMDAHTSKRSRILQESTLYTNYQGHSTFGQFLSLSMDGNYRGNPGVKLQPLWSSTDSEGHENLADVKASPTALKNESSVQTDTLDIAALATKHLSGEAPSSPKKDASAMKGGSSLAKVGLCERKRKFLALTISSSSNDGESSPSKTQSLEVEHFLPHNVQGSRSNPEPHPHCSGGYKPERRNGWTKQSKGSDSDKPHESLKSGEASPAQKANDLFVRISRQMQGVLPQVTGATPLGKQINGSGGCGPPPARDGVSTSCKKTMGGKGRGRGLLLSDPWIQRWCHHRTAAVSHKKREPPVVVPSDRPSTKTFDELQRNKLPSVAAMALMGKAMNGFHPCEFTRRGSLIVWNS